MFVRGDTVVIYGGFIDSDGEETTVEVGRILEVGKHELLVALEQRSWGGPVRIHKCNCEKIEGKFSGIKPMPVPDIGDLVLIFKYDVVKSDIVKNVGTVQAIESRAKGTEAHVLINGDIKKVPLKDCMIL